MKKNNTIQVLSLLVKELGIRVTRQSINDELQKHPDYNSLLAFSDVLNYWRIPNAAYKLDFEELIDLPVPFIAHLSSNEFTLVTQLTEEVATVSNDKWSKKTIGITELKKLYGGAVLIAEKRDDSGEADYKSKYIHELISDFRLPAFFAGALIILLGFLVSHSSYLNTFILPIALLTLFKTAGLITSILLLSQSIDVNNPIIEKLCGGSDKDCNAILSSKAAKVNEYLTWSEVGFAYFAGTWLLLLFNSQTSSLQVLALINVLSLPYTFYSIYYQWRIAKQWCVLCCTVQALLWLELFALLPYWLNGIQSAGVNWWNLTVCMIAPVLLWSILKPYLLQSRQISMLKQQLRRFKYNAELFERLLNDGAKYRLLDEEHSLIIGNREAEHIITMVSNPYCQPCAKAHKALDEWLANRDDIKLQVIFLTFSNEKDMNTEIAAHLMALQSNQNTPLLKRALNDWYEQRQKSYPAWAKKYPKPDVFGQNGSLETQRQWCNMTEITGTPTLFINGRRLPKNYQPEDLRYFI